MIMLSHPLMSVRGGLICTICSDACPILRYRNEIARTIHTVQFFIGHIIFSAIKNMVKTRPDTRLSDASLGAIGTSVLAHPRPSPLLSPSPSPWHPLFLRSRIHAFSRIQNKSVTDGPTDVPTDGRTAWRTDGQTLLQRCFVAPENEKTASFASVTCIPIPTWSGTSQILFFPQRLGKLLRQGIKVKRALMPECEKQRQETCCTFLRHWHNTKRLYFI